MIVLIGTLGTSLSIGLIIKQNLTGVKTPVRFIDFLVKYLHVLKLLKVHYRLAQMGKRLYVYELLLLNYSVTHLGIDPRHPKNDPIF